MRIFKNMKTWIILLGFSPIVLMAMMLAAMRSEGLIEFNCGPEDIAMLFMMPTMFVLFLLCLLDLLSDQGFIKKGELNDIGLTEIDIEFLKDLQHEMLTQDTVCQAAPRFWVVRGTVKEYGIEGDWADGSCVRIDCETIIDSMEDMYEYLLEHHSEIPYRYDKEDDILSFYDQEEEEWEDFDDMDDVCNFLSVYTDNNEAEVIGYRNVEKNFENTFFLTNSECKAHIISNYYHYPADAHSYAMTAFRAPQVDRLWKILDKINWDSMEGK